MSKMPAPKFERAPCPWCGARTEEDANKMCKPTSDETGEVSCAGEFDAQGFSVVITAASIAEIDAWCDANYKRCMREIQFFKSSAWEP